MRAHRVLAGKLIQYAAERQIATDALVRAVRDRGLASWPPGPQVVASEAVIAASLGELMGMLQDPAIPLHIARSICPEQLETPGLSINTYASGHEALQRSIHRWHRLTACADWHLEVTGSTATVRGQWLGPLTRGYRAYKELIVANFLSQYRRVNGCHVVPQAVAFAHGGPSDTSAHQRFFGCPVQFRACDDTLSVPIACLDVLPLAATPAPDPLYRFFAQQRPARDTAPVMASTRVRLAVERICPTDGKSTPSARDIAELLGTSDRTLRRHLHSEGTSFRDIVDLVRRERARRLLVEDRATVAEVSVLCGFSHVTAFCKAFRRWYGRTPSSLQREAPAAPPSSAGP